MPPLTVKDPQSLRELVGKDLGVTEWFRVTQDRIEQFAEATEDPQWIHVDHARASMNRFNTTIAHGLLTLPLIQDAVRLS